MEVKRAVQDRLQNLIDDDSCHLIALSGPFGSGKTTLAKAIAGANQGLYFACRQILPEMNRKALSALIVPETGYPSRYVFHSAGEAMEGLAQAAGDRRLLLVLDDAENLLQKGDLKDLDNHLAKSGLTVLLVSEKPCREAAQNVVLSGFTWSEAGQMLEEMERSDLIKTLAFFGTSPYVLSLVDPKRSFEENVEVLEKPTSPLKLLPGFLINQHLREPKVYNSILYSIAQGADTPTKIGAQVHLAANVVSRYLVTLCEEGFVRRDAYFGMQRKVRYRIASPVLDFAFHEDNGVEAQVKRWLPFLCLSCLQDQEGLSAPFQPYFYASGGAEGEITGVSKSAEKLACVDVVEGAATKTLVHNLYLASLQAPLQGSRSVVRYLFCESADEEAKEEAGLCGVHLQDLLTFQPIKTAD